MRIFRVAVGLARVAREGARRAWSSQVTGTVLTVAMQIIGFLLIATSGWMVYKPLGFLILGVLLVWLGNGLEPEPAVPGDD